MASEQCGPSQSSDLVVYGEHQPDEKKHLTIGLAMSHVSVQAQGLAANQLQLHVNQQILAQQQQLYTEARVQQARAEAASRTNVLVDMIRASRIDPVALEEHVNSKLQSAISVANDVAQTQARAVAEAHAVQHAHVSDVRFAEGFKQLEAQLHASLDERMREILTAHMDQVEAEIRLAITTQGREIMKLVEKQFDEFQKQITAQLEDTKSYAVRKAKTAIQRHHAEESRAHDAISASLLQEITECKRSAVASAALRAEEILHTFVSDQRAVPPAPVGKTSDTPANQHCSSATNAATIEALDGESSTSSDENVGAPRLKECFTESFGDGVQELLRAASITTRSSHLQHPGLDVARRPEQAKVAARALNRSRQLADNNKKARPLVSKASSHKKRGPVPSKADQIREAAKRCSDERKMIKKQRAVDAM